MAWGVYLRHDGKLTRAESFSTEAEAKKWMIGWARSGFFPIEKTDNHERFVPSATVHEVLLKNEDP